MAHANPPGPSKNSEMSQVQTKGSIFPQSPGHDGYFSGMGEEDIDGSYSDETLLHRVMDSTVALASKSFESFGRRKLRRRRHTNFRGQYGSSFGPILEEPANFHSSGARIASKPPRRNMIKSHAHGYLASTGAADKDGDWRTTEKSSSDTDFLEQVRAFPKLPVYIHKQIYDSYGNRILNHFDLTLVRVQNGHIVGSTESVAILAAKPDTDRCWLMGFMKQCPREETDSGLRFNRLLTPQLVYSVVGPTAVEIESSKFKFQATKFIFDFGNAEIAAEFVQLVEELKNLKQDTHHGQRSPVVAGCSNSKSTSLSSALGPVSEGSGSQAHRAESLASHPPSYNAGTPAPRLRHVVRFARENILVFFQSNKKDFEPLAQGALKIVATEAAFNKLELVVSDRADFTTAMEHKIFKWNEICIMPLKNTKYACFWTGCAKIHGLSGLPKFYAFKVILPTLDEAMTFYNAMKASAAHAEHIGLSPASYL